MAGEAIVFAHPISVAHAPRAKRRIVWFAGGGGSSAAMRQAFGVAPDAALNHWQVAIGAHAAHFPETDHYCSDAFEVKPAEIFPGDDIDFGWFSPDCTDFSRAKGKALRSERRRGLAWVVVDWARERRVRCIIVENVAEFQGWGPLYPEGHEQAGERIPEREGETFREWVKALEDLGYAVEWRVLNAADYGAPTTRERLYVKARCDGRPIVWPAPTHAPRKTCKALGRKPWRGACEVIDFTIPCPSIFLTPEEIKAQKLKVKRPLVAATLKRVARGIDRFVISSADPFIVKITQRNWGGDRAQAGTEPLPTVTTAKGGEFAVVEPFLAHLTHQGGDRVHDGGEPLPTVTGAHRGEIAAVAPSIVRTDMQSSAGRNGIRDVAEPLATGTSGGGLAVMGATIVGCGGRRGQSPPCDVEQPFPTVTGKADACLTAAFLAPRYGEREGQEPRANDVTEPYPTVVPDGNGGQLVGVYLDQANTRDVGGDAAEPVRTVAGKAHQGVVAASVYRQFGTSTGSDAQEPVGTIVVGDGGGNGHKTGLQAVYMAQQNGDHIGRPVDDPLSSLTHRATQQKPVLAHLESYYDTGIGSDCAEPMRAATSKPRHALNMAFVEQANTDMVGRDPREPLSTIVLKGCTQRLVELRLEMEGGEIGRRGKVLAFLWDQFGAPTEAEWADPLATREGRLKLGLVVLQGQTWMIVDIGLRMLVPKELGGAMGLPPDMDLSRDVNGRPVTKTDQTHLIGNMVSPPPARALMEADCLGDDGTDVGRAAA